MSLVPDKYLDGSPKGTKTDREKEIEDRLKGKEHNYEPLPGDEDASTKPSKYSKTDFAEAVRNEMKDNSKESFIAAASKISGISEKILNTVHERGAEAWATSGHRPGATQVAWARARVYSFVTGGKTRLTADRDLWNDHLKMNKATSYTPPEKVRSNAKLGLELRAKYGRGGLSTTEAGELGIGSGVQRANDLMEGNVSFDTVKRMKAFFDRHSTYKDKHEKDPPSNSYISWLLWGGDEGYAWAKQIVEQENKDMKKDLFYSLFLSFEQEMIEKNNRVWTRPPMRFDYSGLVKPKKKAGPLKTPEERTEPLHRNPREDDPSLPLRDRVKRQQKHGGKFEFIRAVNYITGADTSILDKLFTDALTEYFSTKDKQATSGMEFAMNRIFDWLDKNPEQLNIKKTSSFSLIDINNDLKLKTESLILNKK
jgi:hypothetical protein